MSNRRINKNNQTDKNQTDNNQTDKYNQTDFVEHRAVIWSVRLSTSMSQR